MKMPGFTAEESLDLVNIQYRMASRPNAFISDQGVFPQAKKKLTSKETHCGICHFTSGWEFFSRTGKKWCYDRTCEYEFDTETWKSTLLGCSDGPLYTRSCGFFGQDLA